jgi:5-methylcytosine-specific restriction endonuclease McrA
MPGSKIRKLCGCGKPTQIHGIAKDGTYRYKSACTPCRLKARKNKKSYCEKCGGTERLEVDHIDGNRSNNELTNLQTLCNNCHIIKTKDNKDNRKYEKLLSL